MLPLLRPLRWPPERRGGLDRLIPVSEGKPIDLHALYVAAPLKARSPSKLGYARDVLKALRNVRYQWSHRSDDRIVLFWLLWFRAEADARAVEHAAHALLRSARKKVFASSTAEWFDVTPEWAQQTIRVALEKCGVESVSLAQCRDMLRWASTVPAYARPPRLRKPPAAVNVIVV